MLFLKFEFEVIIKPGRQNVGPDHLSRIQSGEFRGNIDDTLLDAHLFRVEAVKDHFSDIVAFLMTGMEPNELTITQTKSLVTRSVEYQLIVGQLYKLGVDGILCRCMLERKRYKLLREAHEGVVGGHNKGKSTTHKVLCVGL